MNAKEQTTVKLALEVLRGSIHATDYRVDSAIQLLQSLQVAPKTPKANCAICSYAPLRDEPMVAWLGNKLKPTQVHQTCAESYRADLREVWQRFDAPRKSYFDVKTADLCACGHKASDHLKDELDNLLGCFAPKERNYPVNGKCSCDHFRMVIEDAIEEVAA